MAAINAPVPGFQPMPVSGNAYAERAEFRDIDIPMGTVLAVYRHGKHGHLWLEMTGDAPEPGCDALIGLALNRDQAVKLREMIDRMLAEGPAS